MRKEAEKAAQLKDITYTIVAGETKKNYCKIMTNTRMFTFDKPFNLDYLTALIMRYGKKRKAHQYKSGEIRTERDRLEKEEAESIISELIRSGYLKFVVTQHRDKLHPNIPDEGIKYYLFDKFRVIECEESRYFKQKQQKRTEVSEVKGKISDKRCRALRQIYAQFGDKSAFTYEMVINIPKFYKKMAENKEEKMSDATRALYFQASQNAESKNIDFLDTWNSLIRNNFLLPYRVRAKDGTIKIRQGAYKVNMEMVRRCLSGPNL
jgi:dephospho-CoA kinase